MSLTNSNQEIQANRYRLSSLDRIIDNHRRFMKDLIKEFGFMDMSRSLDFRNSDANDSIEDRFGFMENNGKYIYRITIPRDMLENTKIKEKNGIINISAKKQVINEDESKMSKSISSNSITQNISLPRDAIKNTLMAKYYDGGTNDKPGYIELSVDKNLNYQKELTEREITIS